MSQLNEFKVLFPAKAKRQLIVLFCAMVFTALMEVAGVASVMPFMVALNDPQLLEHNKPFLTFAETLGLTPMFSLRTIAGVLVLVLLVLTNCAWLFTNWLLLRFSHGQIHSISNRLLGHYIHQPYEFHLTHNSADLSKNILTEVGRVTTSVILPMLQLLAKATVTLCLIGLLLFVDAALAITSALVIGTAYIAIYMVIRKRLTRYGQALISTESERFKTVSESFGGIKEIQLSGRYSYFEQKFSQASRRYANIFTIAESMATLPRYILEMIAFGGIIAIALFLIATRENPNDVLPILALYAFVGYRLLPAMQHIYYCSVKIRYNRAALTNIVRELRSVNRVSPEAELPIPALAQKLDLVDISYCYPGSRQILNTISLSIKANTTIGLAGMSGAGKSTLADIILGLLAPTSGHMMVDGQIITAEHRGSWQSLMGYVPQHIYLLDDTIAANIAFGLPPEQIDQQKLQAAAKRAHLEEFIQSLSDGYNAFVGERGVKLSGGQRQRIGIARALYNNPRILVLDEATSALDTMTEHAVMEAISEMAGEVTLIIIAHRLSTLRKCDAIHLMADGKVIATGSYAQLLEQSAEFRAFAAHDKNHPSPDDAA